MFGPDDEGYCYFQGAFFTYDERNDKYVVAADTAVPYLPDGYEEETLSGVEYLKLGGVYYRPYYEGDDMSYVVTKV